MYNKSTGPEQKFEINQDEDHPYCEEYWRMVVEQDIERARALEDISADIQSAEEYFGVGECPVPLNEHSEPVGLDEFEQLFRESSFVY